MSVMMNVSKDKQVLKDQIWFANLPAPTKGKTSVQYGARPVLIVSNNRGNRFSSIVKVVPITSKTKTLLPTHVSLRKEDLGFHNDSVLLCEQEFTIDKEDLIKHLTDLPRNYYEQVDRALFISNQRI